MTDETTSAEPRRPFGRQLSDLWLDGEEGKLHPAEWKLLECAARGERCLVGENRPSGPKNENVVRGKFLRFMALGGDERNPVHEKGLMLTGVWIDESLDLSGGAIPENLQFDGCTFSGELNLMDAAAETITIFDCGLRDIYGPRLEMSGSLAIGHSSLVRGQIQLNGFKTGGNLDLKAAQIEGADISLLADRASVGGHIYLDEGFSANRKVSIESSTVGTGISCRGGQFRAADQSLSLKNAIIGGNVDFGPVKAAETEEKRTPCRFSGSVSLQGTTVNGEVIFTETVFGSACIISLRNAKIAGQLYWRQIGQAAQKASSQADTGENDEEKQRPISELNLSGASCITLNMDWDSWQLPDQVRLDHFVYEGFSELPAEWNTRRWKAWLEVQPDHHLTSRFRPHPYQQLARVLDASGFEEEARAIRIERRERQRIFSTHHEPMPEDSIQLGLRHLGNFWRWVQKIFIGHGYRPGIAVIWLIGLVAIGTIFFTAAAQHGIMTPTHPLIYKESSGGFIPQRCSRNWINPDPEIRRECERVMPSEYSTFSPLIYSLDIAIPVVNFRMEDDWSPRVVDWKTGAPVPFWNKPPWGWGWWVRTWEWFQIGAGWALSLLFVSAIGGIIRRE